VNQLRKYSEVLFHWYLGRTHRSNQVSSPEYIFLISALSGEQRFASIVAKRLESLGALTHGDRRATESRDLSKFNVDTKYGRQALETTLKSLVRQEDPIIKMEDYPKNFFDGEDAEWACGMLTEYVMHLSSFIAVYHSMLH